MKRTFTLLLFAIFFHTLSAQHFVSATYLGQTPAAQFALFTNKATYNVDAYKITYNTVDVDGTPTIASGLVVVPNGASCDSLPMISYAHGTVLRKDDVPSRNNGEALIAQVMASTGAIAVAPDYLGLGDNPGLHPYLHAESEATATIDLMRAAREYAADSLGVYFNGEVFSTGYSQGGHASMATVKYIQDNNLMNEFEVVGAGPASGPYNLSGSQSEIMVSTNAYSNPGYVVYLLLAMDRVYGNIFQNYSDILKAPYDTLIPPYFDGSYDMAVVNSLLPNTLSAFIQDSVLLNFKNDSVARNHPIWQALLAQDNYDWTPSFPVQMFYCTQDEQVSFQNALDAEAAMQANGATATAMNKGAFDHGGCVLPALQGALAFFLSTSDNCEIGLEDIAFTQDLELYPNPAHHQFSLDGFENTIQVKVISMGGRVMISKEVSAGEMINVDGWAKGVYSLEIVQGNKRGYRKLVVR